jgi:hypothetical protein
VMSMTKLKVFYESPAVGSTHKPINDSNSVMIVSDIHGIFIGG